MSHRQMLSFIRIIIWYLVLGVVKNEVGVDLLNFQKRGKYKCEGREETNDIILVY